MSAGSTRAALLVLPALVLAGCPTHEPDAKPFHVKVTVLSTGASLADAFTTETLVELVGNATWEDPRSLVVRDGVVTGGSVVGDVRLSFDGRAVEEAGFPASLADQTVIVKLRLSPEGRGPDLEPLPIPGLRVLVNEGGAQRSVLTLWEGTYPFARVARVLSPAMPIVGEAVVDFPIFAVDEQWVEAEPGECGLAYYDRLLVADPNTSGAVLSVLGRGEKDRAIQIKGEAQLWTVAHAMSYHRDGACEGQSRVFTQLAAWRTPVTE